MTAADRTDILAAATRQMRHYRQRRRDAADILAYVVARPDRDPSRPAPPELVSKWRELEARTLEAALTAREAGA